VDNYGSGATPIVGDQIAAFQGHHQRPWTITQRQFANNLHKVLICSTPSAHAPPEISFAMIGFITIRILVMFMELQR